MILDMVNSDILIHPAITASFITQSRQKLFMPAGPTSRYHGGNDKEKRLQQYKVIGQTLLICEANSWNVGLPWLFPTKRVCDRKCAVEPNLAEFVKTNLVTASSASLESYCDDLENFGYDIESSEKLFIPQPNFIERYALSGLIGFFAFAASFATSHLLFDAIILSLVLGLLSGLVGFIVGIVLAGERVRRVSFYNLLMEELIRRGGGDPRGRSRMRPISIGFPPISK